MDSQFLRFALVGVIGFVLDSGILTVLVSILGLNPYGARVISFTAAVLGTWLINRRWTFGERQLTRASMGSEYMRYMAVQILGAASNLCIFVFALRRDPSLLRYPVIPLALGAAAGLVVNFVGSRVWVFADRSDAQLGDGSDSVE